MFDLLIEIDQKPPAPEPNGTAPDISDEPSTMLGADEPSTETETTSVGRSSVLETMSTEPPEGQGADGPASRSSSQDSQFSEDFGAKEFRGKAFNSNKKHTGGPGKGWNWGESDLVPISALASEWAPILIPFENNRVSYNVFLHLLAFFQHIVHLLAHASTTRNPAEFTNTDTHTQTEYWTPNQKSIYFS